MKIVNIVPGFGGTFYCGNCLRDSVYAASLREAGHDAVTLPVYLPLDIGDTRPETPVPVFYGAVSIYLRQQFPIFRHMPGWMEDIFDSGPLLRYAARKSGSTRASGLEQLTESMLLGRDGNQRHELDRLVSHLRDHEKPDVVHLSNALLLGMAQQIREEAGIPVVCSLQDEDVWVDAMEPAWQERIWRLMAGKARDVAAFIAVSKTFAGMMTERMEIPGEKLHVVPIGVKPEKYVVTPPASEPPALGYLSRICHDNGFHILVDAFIALRNDPRFSTLRLFATGGMTGDDRSFFSEQLKKLRHHGLAEAFVYRDDFHPGHLGDFFRDITILSVPVLKGEAFGLYQLEALASGVPLVQPALGAFPEVIGATEGGVLFEPNSPAALAATLSELLPDQARLHGMSRAGRDAVERLFDSRILTQRILEIYLNVTS